MKPVNLLLTVFFLSAVFTARAGADPSRELMSLDMDSAGAYEKARDLLDSGASANAWSEGGDRAIFHAVKSDKMEIVKLLLDRGADPNVSFDDATGSALDFAVSGGDPEMVRLLIKHKASANYKMRGASTALHTACLQKESVSATEIIGILIEAGADVNAVTHMGLTPLMSAVEADNTPAVALLLKSGADPRIKDIRGTTAIDMAVNGNRNAEIINILKSWKKKGR